jgi:mannosyl-3-phosphoglycerate phosphatase
MNSDRPRGLAGHSHLWRRQRLAPAGGAPRQRIVVVTGLDGTVIERDVSVVPDAQPAIDLLAAQAIPLVIHSSRTRAEIERFQHTLQIAAPFISENGGALFLPYGSVPIVPERARPGVGCQLIPFGRPYHEIVQALRWSCRELGAQVVGFADLSIEEVGREIDAPLSEACLAKLREYSELFRIVDESDKLRSRLFAALHRQGLRCSRARGHHLIAAADPGAGLRALRAIWKRAGWSPVLVGLAGTSEDVPWLQEVDVALLVQHEGTGVPQAVLSKVPTALVTKSCDARGWSEAIVECIGRLTSAGQEWG